MDTQTGKTPPKPWIETPCLYSAALSKIAGCNIYLKLECLQPSGSFKSRGIGHLMQKAVAAAGAKGNKDLHFYCSSGGNAGLACATAARDLGLPATIAVPHSTSPYMVGKLRELDVDVQQEGVDWAAADHYLRTVLMEEAQKQGTEVVYVPPFDHPDIWEGAATMVDELAEQLSETRPDAIVCSVGGGGLVCGLLQGVEKHYGSENEKENKNKNVPVIAVETEGADCLAASIAVGQHVTLPAITSVATSLGSRKVAEAVFAWWQRQPEALHSVVVSDKAAVEALVQFLDVTRLLVEPACGAALAPVFSREGEKGKVLLRKVLEGKDSSLSDKAWAEKTVVVVVCGGSNINADLLAKYRKEYVDVL